jgi:hypothetical protein
MEELVGPQLLDINQQPTNRGKFQPGSRAHMFFEGAGIKLTASQKS